MRSGRDVICLSSLKRTNCISYKFYRNLCNTFKISIRWSSHETRTYVNNLQIESIPRLQDKQYVQSNWNWDQISNDYRLIHDQTGFTIVLLPIHPNSPKSIKRIHSTISSLEPALVCVDLSTNVLSTLSQDANQTLKIVKDELRSIAGDKIASLLAYYGRTHGSLPLYTNLFQCSDGSPIRVHVDYRLLSRTSLPATLDENQEKKTVQNVKTFMSSSPALYSNSSSSNVAGDRITKNILDLLGINPYSRAKKILDPLKFNDESTSTKSLGIEYPFLLSEASKVSSLIRSVDVNPDLLQIRERGSKDHLKHLNTYFREHLNIPSAIKNILNDSSNSAKLTDLIYNNSNVTIDYRSTILGRFLYNFIVPLRTGIKRDIDKDLALDKCSIRDYQYITSSWNLLFPIPSFFWMNFREANMVYNLRSAVKDLITYTISLANKDPVVGKQIDLIRKIHNKYDFEKKLLKLLFEKNNDGKNIASQFCDRPIVMVVNKSNLFGLSNLWNNTVRKEYFNLRRIDQKSRSDKETILYGDNIPVISQYLQDSEIDCISFSEFPVNKLDLDPLFKQYDEKLFDKKEKEKITFYKENVIEQAIDQLEEVYTKLFLKGDIDIIIEKKPRRMIPTVPKMYGIKQLTSDSFNSYETVEDTFDLSLNNENKIYEENEQYLDEKVNTIQRDSLSENPNPNIVTAPDHIRHKKRKQNSMNKNRLTDVDC